MNEHFNCEIYIRNFGLRLIQSTRKYKILYYATNGVSTQLPGRDHTEFRG